ncbi:2og-Fe oxygenase family protein [Diplocarpon rosae]|nr:2og-Fe oxygenase family protein [Diplocarpon rosae]
MTIILSLRSLTSSLVCRLHKDSSKRKDQALLGTGDLPPLKMVALPRVHPDHVLTLSDQGWTMIELDRGPSDPLHSSYLNLLQASRAFFAMPQEYKRQFQTQHGTEEGWSHVEGEKEFITLRTTHSTPRELQEVAASYWAEASSLLSETLGKVAESLGLPAEALTVYSKPCTALGAEETATMLRLFRYEVFKGSRSKIVAESHADLGLLSLVIGDKPGLEVRDTRNNVWFPIERSYESPKGSLLVGRQLERLSNGRYNAGGHRVRSYPSGAFLSNPTVTPPHGYRHSIVLVLRAHLPIQINTDELTTGITGSFSSPLKGITAMELFKEIHSAHFNVNTSMNERQEQK